MNINKIIVILLCIFIKTHASENLKESLDNLFNKTNNDINKSLQDMIDRWKKNDHFDVSSDKEGAEDQSKNEDIEKTDSRSSDEDSYKVTFVKATLLPNVVENIKKNKEFKNYNMVPIILGFSGAGVLLYYGYKNLYKQKKESKRTIGLICTASGCTLLLTVLFYVYKHVYLN